MDALYRWLARDTRPEANAVLGAALLNAEPEYAERIGALLLTRRHVSAWAALVAGFQRLTPPLRHNLLLRPEMVRAGIAEAARDPDPRARCGALGVLSEQPWLQLAYLLPAALRDEQPPVRAAAAHALRKLGERALEAPPAERVELIRALRTALRTYDAHGCQEVLEVSVWLTDDLGPTLWDVLCDPRSRCGYIVTQNLGAWRGPRLMSFLLQALARPAWAPASRAQLEQACEPDELAALLRSARLLADPDVARAVQRLHRPTWFIAAVARAESLPPDARTQLPRWACCVGLSEQERVRCLERWMASSLPELHRAAVYALAALDAPESPHLLARVASQSQPAATFARWYVVGKCLATEPGCISRHRSERGEMRPFPPAGAPR